MKASFDGFQPFHYMSGWLSRVCVGGYAGYVEVKVMWRICGVGSAGYLFSGGKQK